MRAAPASRRLLPVGPVALVVTVVVALVTLLVAGCGANGTGDKGYVAGDSGVTEYPIADRQSVGAVAGTTLTGEKLSLKQLAAGRPTVVNVWATWCGPCRAEAAELQAAATQLGSKAAFLGIAVRSGSPANALAFERTHDVRYPSLYDPDSRSLLEFPVGALGQAIPSTVILDSQGRVAASIAGVVPSRRTVVELVRSADSDSGPDSGSDS